MLAGKPTFGQKWNIAAEMLEQGKKSFYIAPTVNMTDVFLKMLLTVISTRT